jgi:hypothetical protein
MLGGLRKFVCSVPGQASPRGRFGAFPSCGAWRFLWNAVADDMQNLDEKFRLTIPIEDAFGFSMGEYDLGHGQPSDAMRQLVGILVIDALQYGEHWRIATQARLLLAERWPDCPGFRAGNL